MATSFGRRRLLFFIALLPAALLAACALQAPQYAHGSDDRPWGSESWQVAQADSAVTFTAQATFRNHTDTGNHPSRRDNRGSARRRFVRGLASAGLFQRLSGRTSPGPGRKRVGHRQRDRTLAQQHYGADLGDLRKSAPHHGIAVADLYRTMQCAHGVLVFSDELNQAPPEKHRMANSASSSLPFRLGQTHRP